MRSGEGTAQETNGAGRARSLFDMDRLVASVAVTITSLFGAASILVGLHITGAAVDLAAPPLAAPGAAVVGLPVASCDGCSDSAPASHTDTDRAPHAVGTMPRAADPALASAHLPGGSIPPGSPTVPTAQVTQPGTPPANRAPKTPQTVTGTPSPTGSGHVQNATVVNLAPVASVTAGSSGVQVNVLGDSTEGVAKVDLGCGSGTSPGIGISLISGSTTCATPPATTAPASTSGTSTTGTPATEPSPAPGGLLSGLLRIVAAPGGGLTLSLLPGLNQSLLSATVCTSVPGVVVTVGNMAAGCASPATTPATNPAG